MKVLILTAVCLKMLSAHVPFQWSISHIACREHVNPVLVAAIVKTESNFNPRAVGFDPGGYSWGLGQIKWSTARWLGFRGSKTDLLNPATNLVWMVKYLKRLARTHPYGWDSVAAYNLGKARWSGHYANSAYVFRVWRNYRHLIKKKT